MLAFVHVRPINLAPIALAVVLLIGLALAPAGAFAARNPSGTGQPHAECGDPGAEQSPPGFSSGGFSNAETKYAGSGESTDHAGSDHAVSQYDVACYQQTSKP